MLLSMLTHTAPICNVKIVQRFLPAVHQLHDMTSFKTKHGRGLSHCTGSHRLLADKTDCHPVHYLAKRCQSSGMFLIDDTFVAGAEAYFLFIHSLGLEWWLAIPAAAIPIRIGMSLVIGRILTPKFQRLHQVDTYLERRWHFYVAKMKRDRSKLLAAGYRTPEQLAGLVMKNLRADRKQYLSVHSCRPSVILITSLLPLPLWLTMTSALRRIGGLPSWRDWYYRMQETTPCESMMTEGCLWFQDLSVADPYHVLPVLTSVTFLLSTEFSAINNTNVTGYMRYVWKTMMYFSRVWLVVFAALCWNMPAVRAAVGQTESLKRAIRRTKRGGAPAEPAAMADIPRPLPEGYTTTTPENEETFLVYDNQSEDSRILIFASQAGLGLLEDADTWFLDGTFSTAPPQFTQLFSLRVPLGDGHVSAMYALLPGKRQQHYEECLTAILDVCLQRDIRPNPVTVLVDYEVAIHNALRSVISPNIDIQCVGYYWVLSAMTALGINISATFNKRLHLLIRGFPCPHEKPFEEFKRKARKHYGATPDVTEGVPVNKEEVIKALKESNDPFSLIKARLRQ